MPKTLPKISGPQFSGPKKMNQILQCISTNSAAHGEKARSYIFSFLINQTVHNSANMWKFCDKGTEKWRQWKTSIQKSKMYSQCHKVKVTGNGSIWYSIIAEFCVQKRRHMTETFQTKLECFATKIHHIPHVSWTETRTNVSVINSEQMRLSRSHICTIIQTTLLETTESRLRAENVHGEPKKLATPFWYLSFRSC